MSGQCTGWVLRHGPKDRAMRAILLTIADSANRDGEFAHPGTEAMIEGSLYSRATVFRVVTRLAEEGWIEVTAKGVGRGHATEFRVFMDEKRSHGEPLSPEKRSHLAREKVSSGPEKVSSPYLESPPTVTTENPNGTPPTPPAPVGPGRAEIEAVFDAWRTSTGRLRSRLDSKRERLIRLRLGEYPLADLLDAVTGWSRSAHHRGENRSKTVYNELGLILRDAAHVEMFRDLARGELNGNGRSTPTTRTHDNLRRAAARGGDDGEAQGSPGDPGALAGQLESS